MHATVTPSNTASRRLFTSFGERRAGGNVNITSDYYDESYFPQFLEESHASEDYFAIGPIDK